MYSDNKDTLMVSECEFRVKANKVLDDLKSQIDIEKMSTKEISETKAMLELTRLALEENRQLVDAIGNMMDRLIKIDEKLSDLENKG